MAVGATARSLLLAPNGKLRATLLVLRGQDRVGLACDVGLAAVVAGDLSRFKIRVDAEIELESGPVWEIWGTATTAGLQKIPSEGTWIDHGGVVIFSMPFRHSDLGRTVVIGEAPRCPVATLADLTPLRIEIGEPIMGVDLNDSTIPQEGVDVASAVDFTKGCYLGQELVARIDSRGHVNKHLAGLVVDGRDIPPAGSDVVLDDRTVGTVTSAAWSSDREVVVALAMVRVEVPAGVAVDVAGQAGTVLDLPMKW
jgi:folate-binding protein YgfZ